MLHCQATQLTHILVRRLKELAEGTEWDKALRDIAAAMAKEKGKVVEAAEKKAQSVKKAQLVVEKKLTEVEVKLGSAKLKLAEAESLNLAQADEIANLKAALEACEQKWYNEGFVDLKAHRPPSSASRVWGGVVGSFTNNGGS